MILLRSALLIAILTSTTEVQSQETIFIINGKRALNTVSPEFLSFSIDPALIFSSQSAFKNISTSTSLKLAQYMAPGFLQLSGPSTEFLQITDAESVSPKHITVTPSSWKTFNTWIKKSKLTPIFAVNDKFSGGINEVWDPKILSPLLKINDELEFSCYWQLGYDCNYKTLSKYKEDLQTFRNFLDAYPTRKFYKLVGSNLHSCLAHRSPELVGKLIEDLEYTADAVIWETDNAKSTPALSKTYMPIWLSMPKDSNPISFASSLQWAKQIGDAAKSGYKVIFRQPRIHELYSDTPVYWVSLMYKTLMGPTVLDVSTKTLNHQNSYVYANCAKSQKYDRGAITVMIINNAGDQYTSFLRLASSSQPKIVEIETYILTSDEDNSRNVYLNDVKLSMDSLNQWPYKPNPKLRHVKVDKLLSLSVPAKAVGFFVLPAAKLKVCIDANKENILLSQEMSPQLIENFNKPGNLQDLVQSINKEIQDDEHFYQPKDKAKPKNLFERTRINRLKNTNKILKDPKVLRNYINKLKLQATKPKLEIIFTERPLLRNDRIKKVELQLSNSEIKKILTDRAKNEIAKDNIHITSSEAQNVMTEATKTLVKRQKRNKLLHLSSPMMWAKNVRTRTKPVKTRNKRDINMDLLKHTRQGYSPSKVKHPPSSRYPYNTYMDDSMQQFSNEEEFYSREFDYDYQRNIRNKQKNTYDDERIRFLSEADTFENSRIPRDIDSRTIVKRDITHKNSIKERMKQKNFRMSNKSKAKEAKERMFTHLKEFQMNQIEKIKQNKLENRQKLKRRQSKENAFQRHKRMTTDEYVSSIPKLNAVQMYKVHNLVGKSWNPQDVKNIIKVAPLSIENIDSIEFLQIPITNNITEDNQRITEDIIEENAIDYPFNNIYKEEIYIDSNEYNYSSTTGPFTESNFIKTEKIETNAPVLLSNSFINVISDTKNDSANGIRQETKISINEDNIINIITTFTSALLEGIAGKFSNLFL